MLTHCTHCYTPFSCFVRQGQQPFNILCADCADAAPPPEPPPRSRWAWIGDMWQEWRAAWRQAVAEAESRRHEKECLAMAEAATATETRINQLEALAAKGRDLAAVIASSPALCERAELDPASNSAAFVSLAGEYLGDYFDLITNRDGEALTAFYNPRLGEPFV